jgi:hypothetical protein
MIVLAANGGCPEMCYGQERPISVLHLLDKDGSHIESSIWKTEKMNEAEAKLNEAISKLSNSAPGNIIVKPFIVELNGLNIGLVPREDGECYSYMPYDLAFFPPWDGQYDT